MEFRWVATLAVWTILSGPLFVRPTTPAPAPAAGQLLPLSALPSPPAAEKSPPPP